MESWSKGEQLPDGTEDEREWVAMHDDPRPGVRKVWRPRATAREAITKVATWTGFIWIPPMQVRDLSSGEVVWRRSSDFYPEAGPDIFHPAEPLPSWQDDVEWPPPETEQLSMLGD